MLIGGVHIGARALHVLNLTWFGYIPFLYSREEGLDFTRANDCHLSSLCFEGRGSAPRTDKVDGDGLSKTDEV